MIQRESGKMFSVYVGIHTHTHLYIAVSIYIYDDFCLLADLSQSRMQEP